MSADDNDDRGGPVKRLDPEEILNKSLVAYQLAFNDIYALCQAFIDEPLRAALERQVSGVLDIKITSEGTKLIVRRSMRKLGAPAPKGKWWPLVFTPEILAEFFERIRPEPEAEEKAPVDVDATAAAGTPAPPAYNAADMLRARAREARAMGANLGRSADELGTDVRYVEAAAELLRLSGDAYGTASALDREALNIERGSTVQ